MRITPTNSATDSKGVAFGLEGNLFIPVVVSVMLSIVMLAAILSNPAAREWPVWGRYMASFSPVFVTIAYILYFKHRRPPRFDRDCFDQWLGGPSFLHRRTAKKTHPIHAAREALRQDMK